MSREGMSVLPNLIDKADRPSLVGVALARNAAEMTDLDSYLLSVLGDLTPATQEFTSALIGVLRDRFGQTWQESILAKARDEEWPVDRVLQLLLKLPFARDIWAVAESLGDDVRTGYWRAVRFWKQDDDQDNIYAVQQLLAVNRARASIHAIAGTRRALPAILVVEMLMQAVVEPRENPNDRNEPGMFQWSVCQLLSRLDEDPEVQESEIARLEWLYLPLLEHSERPPEVLHGWMSKRPAFFVEVLSAIFPARSEGGSDQEMVTEHRRNLASLAYRLMESWSTVPGLKDGALDGAALRDWVKEAHKLAVNAERGEIGDVYIGRILSRTPAGEDGIWPPAPTRELLEELRNQSIENGIVTGVHRNRGGTRRGMLDGGTLERAEASRYRKWADALQLEWRTAALLERIAGSFDESARHHDETAERTQWTY
jgi:hypothetical protein